MKKFGILIFAAALVIGLIVANMLSFGRSAGSVINFDFGFGSVHGSGATGTEVRNLTGFKAVDVGGVFQIEIVAGRDFSVEVEADDNLLPFITTTVRGSELRIGTEKRLKTSNPIRVRISAPDIDHLDVSGAANLNLTGLNNASLEIDSSGASTINVAGQTDKLVVDVSGATTVQAEALKSEKAIVEASGASSVFVDVSSDLNARASGASKVVYSGSPASIRKKSSGAASISQK